MLLLYYDCSLNHLFGSKLYFPVKKKISMFFSTFFYLPVLLFSMNFYYLESLITWSVFFRSKIRQNWTISNRKKIYSKIIGYISLPSNCFQCLFTAREDPNKCESDFFLKLLLLWRFKSDWHSIQNLSIISRRLRTVIAYTGTYTCSSSSARV